MNRFADINRKRCNYTKSTIMIVSIALMLLLFLSLGTVAAQDSKSNRDLTALSLEELVNIQVTSVSRHAEKLSDTAAAVYVITQEDIRRTGLTSIAEMLRMVTGMQVAHIDSSKWAISARGFTDRFSNKLLVLIDGRSVYTPFFSGVWWDVQDTSIEDIDRIEIIRGPGAALWGANAVNGIINIITKDTLDIGSNVTSVSAELSDSNNEVVTVKGRLGCGAYRFYAKAVNNDGFADAAGNGTPDAWHQLRYGFRTDWEPSDVDTITVQGDTYSGINEQTLSRFTLTEPYTEPYLDHGEVSGGNCLVRLSHEITNTSSAQLQMYYDRTYRKDGLHEETRRTIDIDFQHSFAWGAKHRCMWGLGYRMSKDSLVGNDYIWFSLESQKEPLYSWFFQDEISIVPDKLRLTLGTKLEDNYFTGYELQPNARLLWQPDDRHSVWTSVSRAARNPSRLERDGSLNQGVGYVTDEGLPVLYVITSNPGMEPEKLTAYELGYRVQSSDKFTIDAAAFYNVYDNFRSYDAGIPYFISTPLPHVVQPLVIYNNMNARTYGLELSTNYKLTDDWRISAGYTGIWMKMIEDEGFTDPVQATYAQDTPHGQFHLRSYIDLPNDLELDTMIYYVGKLPHYAVPAYTRVDMRLGWHPSSDTEISLGVRNMLDARHIEFGSTYSEVATEVTREIYAKVTRKF